jgi:hypothetical protein
MNGDQLAMFGIVIAIVTFVLTLLASYIFYRRSIERRQLAYELISKVQLVVRDETRSAEDLEVRYKGRPVEDPYVLLFGIINTGNRLLNRRLTSTLYR